MTVKAIYSKVERGCNVRMTDSQLCLKTRMPQPVAACVRCNDLSVLIQDRLN